MIAPKSHPMLFSAPMVRAILEGRKTQTRRISSISELRLGLHDNGLDAPIKPGERIWVREKWACHSNWNNFRPREIVSGSSIYYAATQSMDGRKTRAAIHMPRWASRIELEVTAVRIERLNDITEADAWAEGCEFSSDGWDCARDWYADLWDLIHGPESWAANPFVLVYEFRAKGVA